MTDTNASELVNTTKRLWSTRPAMPVSVGEALKAILATKRLALESEAPSDLDVNALVLYRNGLRTQIKELESFIGAYHHG